MKLDYIGIALLTLGIGALQVLLDKGQEDDWFGSQFITTLVIVSAGMPDRAGDLGVVSKSAHRGCPLVQKSFNFRQFEPDDVHAGNHVVQQPGDDAAISADADGLHLASRGIGNLGGGLMLLIEMPIMGQLTTKVQARYLIAFGWFCLAIAMFYSTKRIDLMISFSAAVVAARGTGGWHGFSVRADYAGGLYRNSAGEKQCGRRTSSISCATWAAA